MEQVPDGCVVRPVFARKCEAIARVRCVAWLHPRDDFLQLVEPVLLDQERHRLRDGFQDERNQQHRQSGSDEHR